RECRPSLANVRPTDRTTPEETFPPALAQRCARRACRAPGKLALRLVAPRQSAAIVRRRFRQAQSEARTCVACCDTVIDCTVAADWNCSTVAEADTAVGRNSSWDQGPAYHTDRMSCRRRPAALGPVHKNNLARRH